MFFGNHHCFLFTNLLNTYSVLRYLENDKKLLFLYKLPIEYVSTKYEKYFRIIYIRKNNEQSLANVNISYGRVCQNK